MNRLSQAPTMEVAMKPVEPIPPETLRLFGLRMEKAAKEIHAQVERLVALLMPRQK